MLRNLMALFTKSISLYNPIKFLAILYLKSPENLVVDVGSRHNHEIRLLHVQLIEDRAVDDRVTASIVWAYVCPE